MPEFDKLIDGFLKLLKELGWFGAVAVCLFFFALYLINGLINRIIDGKDEEIKRLTEANEKLMGIYLPAARQSLKSPGNSSPQSNSPKRNTK